MSRRTSDILTEKAITALISSIEIYNKPDFKYREENFSILIVNAWELLLKAKILKDNANDKRSLYIKYYPKKKDGDKSKRYLYKKSRSDNYITLDILSCINKLKATGEVDDATMSNILTLLEIRDNATHFYNPSLMLAQNIHEVGSASIRNFIYLLNHWFKKNLDNYNLYLLPLSFLGGKHINATNSYKEEQHLLDYIHKEKAKHPFDNSSPSNYAIYINIEFSKNSKGASNMNLTNDPSAPSVRLSSEELKARYPFDYNSLVKKCLKRYSDFVRNQEFHDLRKKYFDNLKYCYPRFPNLNNTGNPKIYYSSAILEEFDKFYTKRDE